MATAQGSAVLFSEMTPDPSWEADFHSWYDTEHIPLRMAAPGFVSAQRYRAHEAPGYLAVYEMASASALKTPRYQEIKGSPSALTRRMLGGVTGFTRYIGEETSAVQSKGSRIAPLDAPWLYAVWFNVPEERRQDFDDWYGEDHVPLLMQCADWLQVRRFRIVDGEPEPWSHLALHYLADLRALDSPERAAARATPWRDRLARESWFKGKYQIFARHGPRQYSNA
jgi:hypothetical protein